MAVRIGFEGDLEPDEDYEGLRFAEAAFDAAAAGGCHFLDCDFTGVSFGGGGCVKAGLPMSPCPRSGSWPPTWPKPAGRTRS